MSCFDLDIWNFYLWHLERWFRCGATWHKEAKIFSTELWSQHLWIRLFNIFVPSRIPEGVRGIFIFLCCFPSWLKIFLSCWKSSNVTRPDDQIRMSVAALNLSMEISLSILIRKPEVRECFKDLFLFRNEPSQCEVHICIFLHSIATLQPNYLSELWLIFSYF